MASWPLPRRGVAGLRRAATAAAAAAALATVAAAAPGAAVRGRGAQPQTFFVDGGGPEAASSSGGEDLPPRVADLLRLGRGFEHIEELLTMQLAMDYPIFFNQTALLHDFPLYRVRVPAATRSAAWLSVSNLTHLLGSHPTDSFAAWTVAASLLLLLELYDEAHEIVLGNQPLLPEAEVWDWLRTFQAHPDSYWLYRPMSPENHYLHAILHRLEGHRFGEGGLAGFNNAKFWFGGGVEKPRGGLGAHPVYAALAAAAARWPPLRRCCLRSAPHDVSVPPGRLVRVAAGWDPFAFVDFHQAVVEGPRPLAEDVAALRWAQRAEFEMLFRHSLRLALAPPRAAVAARDLLDDTASTADGIEDQVAMMANMSSGRTRSRRWGDGPVKAVEPSSTRARPLSLLSKLDGATLVAAVAATGALTSAAAVMLMLAVAAMVKGPPLWRLRARSAAAPLLPGAVVSGGVGGGSGGSEGGE